MTTIAIDIQNVSLTVQETKLTILDNINYQIKTGDFVILLGSNGSGKSSLLKLLDRRYVATAGKILLSNKAIETYSNANFSKHVITLTQNYHDSIFPSLTIFENCLLVKYKLNKKIFAFSKRQDRLFFIDYLSKFNANLAKNLDAETGKLSGGEKQALALALSILYPPKILLLDEHTSALDPNAASQLMELTHQVAMKNKITCVLTTHDLNIAQNYGNRILALRKGKVHQVLEENKKLGVDREDLLAICY